MASSSPREKESKDYSTKMEEGKTRQSFATSTSRSRSISPEGLRPPLPPRPSNLNLLNEGPTSSGSLQGAKYSTRPSLQGKATTALSYSEFPDGLRESYASTASRAVSGQSTTGKGIVSQPTSQNPSETGDSTSIKSYIPNADAGGEVESLFGDVLGTAQDNLAWDDQGKEGAELDVSAFGGDNGGEEVEEEAKLDFSREFDEIGELDADGKNEEYLLEKWKLKQKHFLILSSAGKPIYTRHGDDGLISGYIGIIQTIISFYQEANDPLRTFSAGGAKFVILSQGPLYLVGISRLFESDAQLRLQLESLYMQILSTLTLPKLTNMFSVRPSTDLRRPLQGTETLLSSLADSFTRGSPSTLLSALECLKIRKSHRQIINSTLLRARVDSLLYGLIVAGGRLVSVVRPKKHSLHPGDLQLIFNMLFEADGIKAGGGESWIPLCLPGFNNKGYLYMYVSFLDLRDDFKHDAEEEIAKDEAVAVILISADKESFFELRKMKDYVVKEMDKNGSMKVVKTAVRNGRPSSTDIAPGTVLRHFLYKSKGNVQFAMPSYSPNYATIENRRRLLSIYHILHASIHTKHAHVKVHHCISRSSTSLAWVTPVFELYCVAGPHTNRNALAKGANKVVQWIQREEERIFIIGGAVF